MDKKIHFILEGNFSTDGDYGINIDNFDEKFRKHIDYDGYEDYGIHLETDDPYYVRDFLEELMVSFRVTSTHHWILPELYKVVDNIHNVIWHDDEDSAYETYGGNYDGTELALYKITPDDNDSPTYPLAGESNGKVIYFMCPRCKREISLYNNYCTNCYKKIDWGPLSALAKYMP